MQIRVLKCAPWSEGKLVSYTELKRIEVWSVLHFYVGFGLSEVL